MSDVLDRVELLTEPEVAAILRCSASKVKRLRLGGKLAYLPGRPVLIERAALSAYLDAARVPATANGANVETIDDRRRADAEARKWALQAVLTARR